MPSAQSSTSPAVSDSATGLAPVSAPDARVLILGSFPSRLSLDNQEYYGNPRNAFWAIMGGLFAAGPEISYADRLSRLQEHGVALWDVLQATVRPGSMDAAIEEEASVANDFDRFFIAHKQLEMICFNGKKAATLYRRLVVPQGIGTIDGFREITMPSTSAAYAAMPVAEKLKHWTVILDAANNKRRR